ncbi:putative transporter YdfM [Weizmannia acidilactici]|uniref:Transporter YdfM n=1 Tax=Weizmannia acidilactici TaxID=2607726 RepID=A0A5J4JJ46_9BACI|nr:cation diffusion facilitator family transporter [Weizmannia acidilactici]GER66696.1 putative transporter YdfM [Weizmannia acidilactici]GER71249.1 putative transporter YdfM [Weizmannia acidilactici]GER72850.1 putative transporter YdfM [Weizmannia acidilactici]
MITARESLARKVAWISVWSNIVLMAGKTLAGWLGNSDAVFADGIHSAADVFASVIVLLVIKVANKPADADHPYGHGKAEVIVSGIVGLLLLLVAFYVVFEAVIGFFHPTESPSLLTLWAAVFSYIAKLLLYRYSLKIARAHNSKAIEAIAYDHKADIAASIAAAFGVVLSIIGGKFHLPLLLYGDKVASIFVAYLIFRIAQEILAESFNILMESNVDPELLEELEHTIHSFPDVRRIDRIRAREYGNYILVDIRIAIDYNKTILEGHNLGQKIKEALMKRNDHIREVLIHLNPFFGET